MNVCKVKELLINQRLIALKRCGEEETMARKTKDAAELTRHEILDAAERVFSESGVARTSLSGIATAANVTRGAVYWHFRDKADLFCQMVARVTMPMEGDSVQIAPADSDDPLAAVRAMLAGILERTARDAQARRVFHIVFNKCEYVDEMQPVWQRFREMQAACLDRLQKGLDAAVRRGQLPEGLDVRSAAVGLHAMMNGLISKLVMDPDVAPAARDSGALIDVFLRGLQERPAQAQTEVRRTHSKKRAKRAA